MKQITFLALIVLITVESKAAPTTQPIVSYDRFTDRTSVRVSFDPLSFEYGFAGKAQRDVQNSVELSLDRATLRGDAQIIFLIDGDKRTRLDLNGFEKSTAVSPEWLKSLADAKTLEIAILAERRTEVLVTREQVQQLRALLDETRFFSPDTVAARRRQAEAQARATADAAEAKRRIEEQQARVAAERKSREDMVAKKAEEKKREHKQFFAPEGGVVYIFDTSGSMINWIQAAKTDGYRAVDALSPTQTFNLIAFDNEARSLWNGMQAADRNSKRGAAKFIDDLSPSEQGLAVEKAFQRAVALKPAAVVFFTDGHLREEQVAGIRRALQGSDMKLNVALVGNEEKQPWMHFFDLVKEVKGSLRRIPLD